MVLTSPALKTLCATAALLVCAAAAAQEYPNPSRTITIVIGYAPGGSVDVASRYFGERLRRLSGAPALVDNRPGALTNIAAEAVARANPDGYTLLIASGNATMASNAHLFKKLPFDPVKDFTPVTTLFQVPFFLIVNPKTPASTVGELSAWLKQRGNKANYGYAGSFALIASELYKTTAGLQAVGIAYKLPQQSLPALIAGDLDFMIQDAANVLRQVSAGKLKALAVTTQRRSALMPELPTMEESGLPGYDLMGWFGLYLPANAPPVVVDRLNGWFNQMLREEDTRKALANVGNEPLPGSPQSLSQLQAREYEKWGRLLKTVKLEAE